MHTTNCTAARFEENVKARPRWSRFRFRARNERGSTLVEFALVLPVFLMLCTGILSFGVVFNQYLELNNAVTIGTNILAASRGDTSAPCTQAIAAIYNAAPFLTESDLAFTFTFTTGTAADIYAGDGTPITYSNGKTTSQAQCDASAEAANSTILQQDQNVTLVATYTCNILIYATKLPCKLSAQTTEVIQ